MAYAKIRLNFETINKAYRDFKSLPPQIETWLRKQNDWERAENEKIKQENGASDGLPPSILDDCSPVGGVHPS